MKKIFCLIILTTLLFSAGNRAFSQAFTFAPGQLSYSENFDGMGATGTTYLTGWTAIRFSGTGTVGAVLAMVAGDGSGNSGNVYNVGTAGSDERAFGSLASGSTVPQMGASYLNNTGASIIQLDLTGVMEQWRSGSNATANEVDIFEYSLDATDLTNGTWTAVPSFDLVEKITTSTVAAALDGNLPANQTALTASITGINWTAGTTLWIRWTDANDVGSDALLAIDNLAITATTGTVTIDPEPTNYPTAFTAAGQGLSVLTSWTDATGTQLPSGYLVKISSTDNITAPADGTYEADDLNLADGSGAKNVTKGTQQYAFSGLAATTTYYFRIFPYTNAGSLVNYKTDGTIPSASAGTQAIISQQAFENGLDPWTQFSVLGDQVWVLDSIHGVGLTKCAKMSGYANTTNLPNTDWLISPSMNLPAASSPKIQFFTAMNYGPGGISFLASNDYTGGDPSTNGTWTDLSANATFSAGGWAWTASSYLDLSGVGGSNVHVAFKYTSDATTAATWEVDDVLVTVNSGVGINENPKANNLTGIYPNPCSNWFQVKLPSEGKYLLDIYTNQGTQLMEQTVSHTGTRISTASIPSGSYMVSLENKDTHAREMHKLIVK